MTQNLATANEAPTRPMTRAGVLRALAEQALDEGSLRRAAGLARSAIGFAAKTGDDRERGLALLCLAEALDGAGLTTDAAEAARDAARSLAGHGEAAAEARARASIAAHQAAIDPERAAEEAVRARRLLDHGPATDARWVRAAARVATAEARLGAPERAAELAHAALADGGSVADAATRAELNCRLAIAAADEADALAREGRVDDALARREQGFAIAAGTPRPGIPEIAIELDIAEGRLAAGLDRPILALARLGAAATRAEGAGHAELEALAHTQLCRVLLRVGSWSEAAASLDRAESVAGDTPSELMIAVLELRERLLAIEGRASEALPTVRAALRVARDGRARARASLWDEARTRVDLAEAERREAALARLSRLDALTGVPNRRAWDRQLPQLVAAADLTRPLSVAVIDLDHFKQINDRGSHLVGDRALRGVASVLASGLRQGDLLARLGGDEFGVAIMGHDPATATAILERLRGAVADGDWSHLGDDVPVTVSIGIAHWTPGDTAEDLLTRADHGLYDAKHDGRDRVVAA